MTVSPDDIKTAEQSTGDRLTVPDRSEAGWDQGSGMEIRYVHGDKGQNYQHNYLPSPQRSLVDMQCSDR